jgi:hypothetical protein
MSTSMPSAAHLEKLQNLTQNYAQFSRNRAGLAYLVLSVLLPMNYLLARNLPLNTTSMILGGLLCITSISLWLVFRWKFVEILYQKFGVARSAMPLFTQDFIIGIFTGILFGTFLVWVLSVTTVFRYPETFLLTIPTFLIATVMGVKESRHSGSFAGLAVILCGGFIAGGINSNATNLSQIQRIVPLVLLVIIPVLFAFIGFREHQQFKQLEVELESLQSGQS